MQVALHGRVAEKVEWPMARACLQGQRRLRRACRGPQPERRCLGITLIELLVILAIVLALTFLGILAYNNYRDGTNLARAGADIQAIEQDIYIYTRSGIGQHRFGKLGNPLNTDFDLYSLGRNGLAAPGLDKQESSDGIVRAANGEYLGLASEL